MASYYYSFGEYDGFAIYEAPDEKMAMTTVVAAGLTGGTKATKTTVLITVEETMGAFGDANQVTFKTPGK